MKLIGPDGVAHPLEKSPIRVGRSVKADIAVPDKLASAKHATITLEGDAALIEDLGSTNGTFVNGQRIDAPTRLQPGDSVKIGGVVFTVQADDDGASMAEPRTEIELRPEPVTPPARPTPPPPPPMPAAPPMPSALAAPVYQPSGGSAYKDKSLTIILEILPGLFGFLGIGWIYAGQTTTGILLLLGNLLYWCVTVGVATITVGISLLCMYPIALAIVIGSVVMLNDHIKKHPELFR